MLLSSAAVYAGRTGRVDPSTPVDPPMAYALSKLYVEGLVRSLVAEGQAGDAVVVRLYNAYGPGERATRLIPRVVAAVRAATLHADRGGDLAVRPGPCRRVRERWSPRPGRAPRSPTTSPAGTRTRCPSRWSGSPGAGARAAHRAARPRRPDADRVLERPSGLVADLALGRLMPLAEGVRAYADAVGWSACPEG